MLNELSPLDGRYVSKTKDLRPYLSECALIKYRFLIEREYLKAISNILDLSHKEFPDLNIAEEDYRRVKEIEKKTNHDVKAVEYLLREKILDSSVPELSEWIHFALTSQDINNTAFPLMIKGAWRNVLLPKLEEIIQTFKTLEKKYATHTMLSRTHGQPASPTKMGKEIGVFRERLEVQLKIIESIPWTGKFGGATGNFNAHQVAFPKIDWKKFADEFLSSLGLQRQQTTTQIEHYDMLAAFFHGLMRMNTILIDFCRDIWTYISFDYFGQKIKDGEVGSSTMPHKVNPIDFENAEGNLGIANAISTFLSNKLPVSRLQRDLTDSTVLRNVGVPLGHTLIAYKALTKGISKLKINPSKLKKDLDDNWAVVTEAIQTILRREGVPNAYEKLKSLSRVEGGIHKSEIHNFIESLEINEEVKEEMKRITPQNYFGIH